MNTQVLLAKLNQIKNGQYCTVEKSKEFDNGIIKITKMVVRKGIDYSHMGINADRQTGELPWGHWVEGLENLVIEHNGQYYLRVSSTHPADPTRSNAVSSWFKNGQPITYAEAVAELGEKKTKSKASSVYAIKFDNIINIVQGE